MADKLDQKNLQFDTDEERQDFEESLIDNAAIQKFIESAFNGNILVLPPIDREKATKRFQQANYISNLNSNRPEIMKKIHKVNYTEIFSDQFNPEKIDANLHSMELDEKLFLLDNIIDYLYYNFKNIRDKPEMDKTTTTSPKKGTNSQFLAELKKRKDKNKAMAIKLQRRGIFPSLSIDYKKAATVASHIGNAMPQRDIKRLKGNPA